MNIQLSKMSTGQKGEIKEIQGGHGMASKLDAMGIRVGSEIIKVSSQLMRGPVTLRHGNTEVAVGFGMAQRIIVQASQEGGPE